MNEELLKLIEAFIDAKIDKAIDDAFGRDGLHSAMKVHDLRDEIRKAFIQ